MIRLLGFRLQPARVGVRWHASCRAAVLKELGAPENFKVEERPTPELRDAKDVRVKVVSCGVCYRDVLDRQGAFPFIQDQPIIGHEIAGVVEEVGEGVEGLSLGDKVVSLHWAPCGECRTCKAGQTPCERARSSFLGLTVHGGYATHAVNGASGFVKLNDFVEETGWTPSECSTLVCTYGTVWHGVVQAKLTKGETVLVTGASGGVGTAAIQILRAMGCKVVAHTSTEEKVGYLESVGADVVVACDPAVIHKQKAVKSCGGVDAVLECVGGPTFSSSLKSLRPAGRMVLIGNVTNAVAELPLGLVVVQNLAVLGSDSVTSDEMADLLAFLKKEGIRPTIHNHFPLERVREAHELLEGKGAHGRSALLLGDTDRW